MFASAFAVSEETAPGYALQQTARLICAPQAPVEVLPICLAFRERGQRRRPP